LITNILFIKDSTAPSVATNYALNNTTVVVEFDANCELWSITPSFTATWSVTNTIIEGNKATFGVTPAFSTADDGSMIMNFSPVIDAGSNTAIINNITLNIKDSDSTAPILFEIQSPAASQWVKGNVNIQGHAFEDKTTVSEVKIFSNNAPAPYPGLTFTSPATDGWRSFTNYINTDTLPNGVNTLTAHLYNQGVDVEIATNTFNIQVDRVKPGIPDIPLVYPFLTGFTFNLHAVDTHSGIEGFIISNITSPSNSLYTNAYSNIVLDGLLTTTFYEFYIYTVDKAGNRSIAWREYTNTTQNDTTPPGISNEINGQPYISNAWYNSNDIALFTIDEFEGYPPDQALVIDITNTNNISVAPGGSYQLNLTNGAYGGLLTDGTHTFTLQFTNFSGHTNINDISLNTVILNIDNTAPAVDISNAAISWSNDLNLTISWNAPAELSGIDYYQVAIGSVTNNTTSEMYSTTAPLTFETHTIYIRGVDIAGNAGNWQSRTTSPDSLLPDSDKRSIENAFLIKESVIPVEVAEVILYGKYESGETITIEIIDISERPVFAVQFDIINSDGTFYEAFELLSDNGTRPASGFYMVRITSKAGITKIPIIIQ
jgi:hypothetical protein